MRAELRKPGITLAADANVTDCMNLLREILREEVILPAKLSSGQSLGWIYDSGGNLTAGFRLL
jgi:hypothetical protein